jgi:DNA-directed RNA polymerase specialized sigma24 family protein
VIETGFGQAVAAAFPGLYRFAVALSSRDEADDLVQDALTMVAGPEDATADLDLLRAIAQLPPRQRGALVLRLYVDLPLDDVAALMRCSTGTVKATLHAARTAVGRSLGADYGKG